MTTGHLSGLPRRQVARHLVDWWVQQELAQHADKKWNERHTDDQQWDQGFMPGAFWRDFVDQYLHRAAVLGVENAGGRQALMKALVTLHEACVSVMLVYGSLPKPGQPSGELAHSVNMPK